MRIQVNEQAVVIRLSLWEKILGLLGNITVPRSEISDVQVVEDPLSSAFSAGVKVGLRLPGVIFIARTIHLDEAFIVRRGMPGLSFTVGGDGRLRRVLVGTRDAKKLAAQLRR